MRKVPTLPAARERLLKAADSFSDAFPNASVGLWDGDTFNVAPTRVGKAAELRAKGVNNWDAHDLDYVMFKCMTTMGDAQTFLLVAPRYFRAVACAEENLGWTTRSHVVLSKLKLLDLDNISKRERTVLFAACEAFAMWEWAESADGQPENNVADIQPDDGIAKLLAYIADFA